MPSKASPDESVTRFVLLSIPRSGTSWLIERLAKHPEVGGYGELLLRGSEGTSNWPAGAADRVFFTTYLSDRGIGRSDSRRHRQLFRYLDYVFEPRRALSAIGFKLMYSHMAQNPAVLPYLHIRNVRVVHLFRTNLLDLFLSREAVTARKWMHARAPGERERILVNVDAEHIVQSLLRLEKEQRLAAHIVRTLRVNVLELSYEGLLADDAGLYHAFDFLGITETSGVDVSPIMLKLASQSQREGMENFDEVAAILSRTRFSHFLRP
jgi:LPS sulfotransferase NodH